MGQRPVKLPRKTRILISRAIQTSSSNGLPGITGRGREWNSTDISSLLPERRQVSVLSACLALHVGLIRLSMKSKGERNGQKNDRKGKAEGTGGRVVRIVRERVANICWRGPLALPTDEGAVGFVALIYAKTGAVYYRYCWMCACVKLETQTSVHANLTRPSASARYSPRPSDKEGTLLSSPFAPFSPTLAPETNLRHPINRLPCSFL